LKSANSADIKPAFAGMRILDDGRKAVPVFELMARRYFAALFVP